MAMFMMAYMLARGESVWTNPNLVAVMWLGPEVAGGRFGWPTVAGFATHMGASVAMGVIGIPFVSGLPPRRTILASLAYALASYPVAIAAVMTWANPLFVDRTHVVPMTIAHAVFGFVYGLIFLLRPSLSRP